jgi:hypothetical protein
MQFLNWKSEYVAEYDRKLSEKGKSNNVYEFKER